MKNRLLNMLPHLTIILSLFIGTLWVLNQLNPLMGFLDNQISDIFLILLCISSLITSAITVWRK